MMTLDEAVLLVGNLDEIQAKTKLAIALRLLSGGIGYNEPFSKERDEWRNDVEALFRSMRREALNV